MWFKKLLVTCIALLAMAAMSVPASANTSTPEITGYHDGATCNETWGWIRDANSAEPLNVGFWLDYSADSVFAKKIGETKADLLRPDLPFPDQKHGFTWFLPDEYKDTARTIYAYVLNSDGKPEKLLNFSDKNTGCNPGELFPTGTYLRVRKTGLKVYSGPSFKHRTVKDIWGRSHVLKKGMTLKINKEVIFDEEGNPWYRVTADLWNRYRSSNWYIPANYWYIKKYEKREEIIIFSDTVKKWVEIDLSTQTLKAWERNEKGENKLALETLVSTGVGGATRRGAFKINSFRMHSYMKGWDYDLPGVPFDMYFDGTRAIHGAYWHNNFGHVRSHGCINLPLDIDEWLWTWVNGKHITVIVK